MQSIEDYKQYLVRADYGLMFLLACTALCVALTLLLWRRWPAFRRISSTIAPALVPAALLTVSWPLALASAALGSLIVVLVSWLREHGKLALIPAIIWGLGLRIARLNDSLWYDEAFTQRLTTLALPQLPAAILADVHPPLFYALEWLWARIAGTSAAALRLPSLVFGLLAIYLLYRLVKALGLGERVALLAALLCAVTPSAIYYSTEARSYALLTCAVFGALIALLEDRPLAFIFSTALIAWVHNLGLMYVPVLCLAALLYRTRGNYAEPRCWRWLVAPFVAGLLSLVWVPFLLRQAGSVTDGFWISFDNATPLWSVVFNLLYLQRAYILPIMLPYVGLLLLGFYASRRWLLKTPGGRIFSLLLLGAPGLTVLVSVLWAPVYVPRLFLPLNLLCLIPLAYALETHGRRLLLMAAPLLLASLAIFQVNVGLLRPDYNAMVAQGCAGAEAMYYTALDTAITIAPVWTGASLVWAGGQDRGLTFKADQMGLFNFQEGDISAFAGQMVCVVYIYSPRTLQQERDFMADLLRSYPDYTGTIYEVASELEVQVYRLQVKG